MGSGPWRAHRLEAGPCGASAGGRAPLGARGPGGPEQGEAAGGLVASLTQPPTPGQGRPPLAQGLQAQPRHAAPCGASPGGWGQRPRRAGAQIRGQDP